MNKEIKDIFFQIEKYLDKKDFKKANTMSIILIDNIKRLSKQYAKEKKEAQKADRPVKRNNHPGVN